MSDTPQVPEEEPLSAEQQSTQDLISVLIMQREGALTTCAQLQSTNIGLNRELVELKKK